MTVKYKEFATQNKEMLHKLYIEEGATIDSLMLTFGLCQETVSKALKYLGFPSRNELIYLKCTDRILELYQQGLTLAMIATDIGRHINVVKNVLKKNNLPISIKERNFIGYDYLYDCYVTKRMSYDEIAIDVNLSSQTVRNRILELGIRDKLLELTNKNDLLLSMYKDGETINSISAATNTAPKTIRNLLNKESLPTNFLARNIEKPRTSWKGYELISLSYFSQIKRGAETRGLPLEITIEDIWNQFTKQNGLCALTGKEIFFTSRVNNKTSKQTASLDRIDSSKGYTKDNIQWVHKDINVFKMDLSEEKLLSMCREIVTHADNQLKPSLDLQLQYLT